MEVCQDLPIDAWLRHAPIPITLVSDAAVDSPVSVWFDQKDDLVLLMTKMSYLYMFDIRTGKTLYWAKIMLYIVFVTCTQKSTGTMFGITVISGSIFGVQMNGQELVPYNVIIFRDNDLAIKVTKRLN